MLPDILKNSALTEKFKIYVNIYILNTITILRRRRILGWFRSRNIQHSYDRYINASGAYTPIIGVAKKILTYKGNYPKLKR